MKFSAFFQAVPPAPGRGESAPQPGQLAPDAPSGPGPAGPPGGGLGGMFPLLLIVPMILVMFFMNSRQQKRQKETESKLKIGDRVVTQSGIIGKLTEKTDRYIKVEIAPGIKVQMLRTALNGLDSADAEKAVATNKQA